MWNPRKTLVLHDSRETLARLLYRRIRHLCTTYKMQMYELSISSMLYVYGVPVLLALDDPRWSSMIWYDAMLWLLLTSFFVFLFLLKSLFFFSFLFFIWPRCTNQDNNCVYAGTILWHKGWYDDTKIWYVCNGRADRWLLMCTSNVAGNTQWLVSIGKWRKMG